MYVQYLQGIWPNIPAHTTFIVIYYHCSGLFGTCTYLWTDLWKGFCYIQFRPSAYLGVRATDWTDHRGMCKYQTNQTIGTDNGMCRYHFRPKKYLVCACTIELYIWNPTCTSHLPLSYARLPTLFQQPLFIKSFICVENFQKRN